MKIIIFLFAIILILYAVIILEKFPNNNNKNYDKEKSKNTKNCDINIMTPEKCYNNNIDICPMSSYKQCTNNLQSIYYPPLSKCVCNSFSLELCNDPKSNSCNIKKCNSNLINQEYPIYSKCNPRVNIYNTESN